MVNFGFKKGAGSNDASDAAFAKHHKKLCSPDPACADGAQGAKTLRVFDRNGFFTCHGSDALFVARHVYKTTAVIKHWFAGHDQDRLATVSMNKQMYDAALRCVLVADGGDQVERSCVQVFQGSGANWRVAKEASPGKLGELEDELFQGRDAGVNENSNPVVMCACLHVEGGQRRVGVAFCDTQSSAIGACEFVDDDRFCALEALAVQVGARECVVLAHADSAGEGSPARRALQDVFDKCSAMATFRPSQAQAALSKKHRADLESDLQRMVVNNNLELCRDVLDRDLAARAAAGLLQYMDLASDVSQYGKWRVRVHNSSKFMRLDSAALKSLHVFTSLAGSSQAVNQSVGFGSTTSAASCSLAGLMARGRTAMGKRLARSWLKQPLVDPAAINTRLDVVSCFVDDVFLRDLVRDTHLRGMPDLDRLTRRLERKASTLQDLCLMYRASCRLPLVVEALRAHEGEHKGLLEELFASPLAACHAPDVLGKFEDLVENAVDLDRVPDEYLVNPSYDQGLQDLWEQKAGLEAEVDALASRAADDLGLVMDKTAKVDWFAMGGQGKTRCLRVTQKEEKHIRGKLNSGAAGGKYIVLETRKDGTKFTTRALRAKAEQLAGVCKSYDEQQRGLVSAVVGVACSFADPWRRTSAVLAELDALAGFADLSRNAPGGGYIRPEVVPAADGRLELAGARHPCVEAAGDVNFIANDCKMVRGESHFHIITGPNMGGKSTFIRSVGCVVLMAQCGCFVPCSRARVPVRDAIFTRIGAGDCQVRGVSTFMQEMLETAVLLKSSTEDSLVIIDELGRGTSTSDGFGLACAISEHLAQVTRCPTLFATHFHELTERMQAVAGVQNFHVETDVDEATGKLTMLYSLRAGGCDRSFGIAVAEKVKFPREVIASAKEYEQQLMRKRVKCSPPEEVAQ